MRPRAGGTTGIVMLMLLCTTAGATAPQEVVARVRAAREIDLASKTSGVVVERPVKRNAIVREGEVVLRIDDTLARIAVHRAKASLARARAELTLAKNELARTVRLGQGGSANESEVDQAHTRVAAAEAAQGAADADLAQAEEELARAAVKAPAAGVLSEIHAEVGEFVTPQVAVAQILTIQDLVAEAFLSPTARASVTMGMPVEVLLTSPVSLRMEGKVRELAAAAGSQRTFRMVVGLPKPPAGLRAGYEVRLRWAKK